MVSFTGDKEMMYRANFQLHTAIRILKPIKHFKARSAEEVYDQIQKIKWDDILDVKKTFSVDSVVYSEEFRNSRFVTYKVKDAIVDWFREKQGTRPNISVSNPDIRLNIHIAEDNGAAASWTGIHKARTIVYNTLGRREPEGEARNGTGKERYRQDPLHTRRAYNGTSLRGHTHTDGCTAEACR